MQSCAALTHEDDSEFSLSWHKIMILFFFGGWVGGEGRRVTKSQIWWALKWTQTVPHANVVS